ncbi:hypothetical protein AGDE_04732 [Angomonas deanei]|uniref:Predicted membrane protein, putative n=1 Tax=Angomonas deanei TaxID=59799 RepID=S9V5Z2_9TRYP|nr:hypothetical protein AGDE_07013 [Angomonas deanei]EPY39196.1 hypothetical protein AGDE_04732 [Angomonas deanei]CAD2213029.1 Predicted membrane protein, putative [Angomonas deanei]|eukprot:EPY36238.1 hypothetical protein AGDE_07013 [Angomonas deanei]
MRIRAYHRHNIQRNSIYLSLLLTAHLIFSFCFTAPILFTFVGIRVSKTTTTSGDAAWMLAVSLLWFLAEAARIYLGNVSNKKMRFPELISFTCITVVPQIVLISVYYGMVKERTPYEYGACVTQIILLVLEFLFAARLMLRLGRNNTIDFYVYLGQNRYLSPQY